MDNTKITPRFGSEADFLLLRAKTLLEQFLLHLPEEESVELLGPDIGSLSVGEHIGLIVGAVARLVENQYQPPCLGEYYYRQTIFALFDGAANEFECNFPAVPERMIASAADFSQAIFDRHLPGRLEIEYSRLSALEWNRVFGVTRFLLAREFPCPARHGSFSKLDSAEASLEWVQNEVFRNLATR